MRILTRYLLVAAACISIIVSSGQVHGSIYVMGNAHFQVTAAKTHLSNLGHTVVSGGTLSDYSAYDQVWDLRYDVNLTTADGVAMGNYLQGGGRMYLTGEHDGFDSSRNNSLVSFLNGVGAGPLSLASRVGFASQSITALGQIVNSPNTFSSVDFNSARTAVETSAGFLVTETVQGSNEGSLVGWDFGDIVGRSNARMLVGFDIEIFQNGINWTENMETFLGANRGGVVPEPTTALIWSMLAGLGMMTYRRRR